MNANRRTVLKGVGAGTATLLGGAGAGAAKPPSQGDPIVDADSVPTLNGATVDVDGTDLNGDQSDIVDTTIEASNGIIHVIDGVLLP